MARSARASTASKAKQSKAKQSSPRSAGTCYGVLGAERAGTCYGVELAQSKAKQSRAKQSKAKQSKEQSTGENPLIGVAPVLISINSIISIIVKLLK